MYLNIRCRLRLALAIFQAVGIPSAAAGAAAGRGTFTRASLIITKYYLVHMLKKPLEKSLNSTSN